MGTILRRVILGLVALFILVIGAGLAVKVHGEARLADMTRRFTAEVGPIPSLEESLEQRRRQDAEQAKVLAIHREASAVGDAALLALRIGNRRVALARLRELIAARDGMLARPNLPAQIIGVSLGEKVVQVADEYVRSGGMSTETKDTLADALQYSWMGWSRTLAHEAALSLYASREGDLGGGGPGGGRAEDPDIQWVENKPGPVEGMMLDLQMSSSVASALGLYLGMFEAVRDDPADVAAYLERARAGAAPGTDQMATFLIPDLVSITEKHRDYRRRLEEVRSRLMTIPATGYSA